MSSRKGPRTIPRVALTPQHPLCYSDNLDRHGSGCRAGSLKRVEIVSGPVVPERGNSPSPRSRDPSGRVEIAEFRYRMVRVPGASSLEGGKAWVR